jgi:hypothetical protein
MQISKSIKEVVKENQICNLKNLQLQKGTCPTALARQQRPTARIQRTL